MRLSIVSLLVVTASFAIGGCAADAESPGGTTGPDQPNVALQAPADEEVDNSRINDVREMDKGKVSDQFANPSDAAKARLTERYKGGQVDPRIEIQPSIFGQVPVEKLGVGAPVFNPLSTLEQNIKVEQGYLPYSHKPKDD